MSKYRKVVVSSASCKPSVLYWCVFGCALGWAAFLLTHSIGAAILGTILGFLSFCLVLEKI